MIPKTIHTFWLSDQDIDECVLDNIKTWECCNKDFNIIIHRRDEFKHLEEQCKYYKEMLDRKQWAYASDYLRNYVLYNQGGIYLDGDVVCLKPFDELIQNKNSVLGYECFFGEYIECAVMMFSKHHSIPKLFLQFYEKIKSPRAGINILLIAHDLMKKGKIDTNSLLPEDFLSGKITLKGVVGTQNSYCIHKFSHTGY